MKKYALALIVMFAPSAFADGHKADLNDYSCRDIMLAAGDERDMAVMFMQGYFVGKSGKTTFDKDKLAAATDRFLEICIDAPKKKAVDAMQEGGTGESVIQRLACHRFISLHSRESCPTGRWLIC